MEESRKRGTAVDRAAPQRPHGDRPQPDEGQPGPQPEQRSDAPPQPGRRGPQRQNQNVGPSDENN